ncbi:hypothetical protein [Bradyrhizobium sp. 188]|uniref:hypothetical protein n=1 Tax=Bradyrhizobium sp. 188 TaxID=2782656 RepID=UPI001FF90186|nr:hypothetical protein [Bradyrhizobium sp. 188]MCK1498281.1 hypothetical protein [Bradyrhizobium sp. 188]
MAKLITKLEKLIDKLQNEIDDLIDSPRLQKVIDHAQVKIDNVVAKIENTKPLPLSLADNISLAEALIQEQYIVGNRTADSKHLTDHDSLVYDIARAVAGLTSTFNYTIDQSPGDITFGFINKAFPTLPENSLFLDQCVALVQALDKEVGPATHIENPVTHAVIQEGWHPSTPVVKDGTVVANLHSGDPIATFDADGHYDSNHAAIFLGTGTLSYPGSAPVNGFFVLDQYNVEHGTSPNIVLYPEGTDLNVRVYEPAEIRFIENSAASHYFLIDTKYVAPPPPPPPPPSLHAGNLLFSDNFDNYTYTLYSIPISSLESNRLQSNPWGGNAIGQVFNDDITVGSTHATSGDYYLNTTSISLKAGEPFYPFDMDMGKAFSDPTGGQAVLTVDVASQSVFGDYVGQSIHYQTDPLDTLIFKIDGHKIGEVHPTDDTNFHPYQFVFDTGSPGSPHTLEIQHVSNTPGVNHVGFAVDTLHINDWTTDPANLPPPPPPPPSSPALLFSENFDNFGQTVSAPYVADLAGNEWRGFASSTAVLTETVLQPKDSSLDFYLNTRDAQDHEINIWHDFVDPTLGKALLSFDFAVQPGMDTSIIRNLEVFIDGNEVADRIAMIPAAGQPSGWQHIIIDIDAANSRYVGRDPANTEHAITIWDRSHVPANTVMPVGFAIDNIQIHDLIV